MFVAASNQLDPLHDGEPRTVDVMKTVLLKVIGWYRATAPTRTPRCRYIPTCSQYAEEAITTFGAARGSWLFVRRIGRCHPFGSFGFDPVPEK